ncbi:hypothetical protein, partial [uncultured Maribacter sp.]|uniref:hypothetical protein n=1 Tax=uncultured Maribacter sp. TaxID=431308 RepID=UPI0026384CD3
MASAYKNGEKLRLTQPKRNAVFWAKSKGLCIFMMSLNLWDLALEKKKKQNQKLQLRAQTETKSFLASALRLAQP